MSTALAIKQAFHGKPAPSILTVIVDEHNVHCMTEELIDTWWLSLTGFEKAELYEASLEESGDRYDRVLRVAMLQHGLQPLVEFIDLFDANNEGGRR
jgi:hypothetical protein